MHQRFAARKHDPAYFEGSKAVHVRPKIFLADFTHLADLPDVAHQAAAITAIVREQDQDGQFMDAMIESTLCRSAPVADNCHLFNHALTCFPAKRISEPRNL